jgi:hypothetical protein
MERGDHDGRSILSDRDSYSINIQLHEGGVYSIKEEDGTYGAIKILKIDDYGVHICQYSNQFKAHPDSIDLSILYMAGIDKESTEKMGVGHIPVSNESFANWKIRLIQVDSVTDDEMDGYGYWKEQGGGYF